MTGTVVDWAQYPPPWPTVGRAFAREVHAIVSGSPPPGKLRRHDILRRHLVAQRPLLPVVERLRDSLEELGMTQRYAAKRLGYARTTVQEWLSGKDRPTASSVKVIETFLAELAAGGKIHA